MSRWLQALLLLFWVMCSVILFQQTSLHRAMRQFKWWHGERMDLVMKVKPPKEARTLIPAPSDLKNMSTLELEMLIHSYISGPQTTCFKVERMGNLQDGGWELCQDPRYAPDPKNCLVYSFGINDDFSFDDAMEKYGCEVHSFDPSMTKTADHLRGQRVHFHQQGIGGKEITKEGSWQLHTLHTFRKLLGHTKDKRTLDMVKMDVEGAEKASLPQAFRDGSLSDVRQLAFELHFHKTRTIILANLMLLQEAYRLGFRIYMTNRNKLCSFTSRLSGLSRTHCHEVYMLNEGLARPGYA